MDHRNSAPLAPTTELHPIGFVDMRFDLLDLNVFPGTLEASLAQKSLECLDALRNLGVLGTFGQAR